LVADVGVRASLEGRSMVESPRCRVCEEVVPGRTIPVLLPGQRCEDFFLCESCWQLLERGFRRTAPDGAPEPSLDGSTVRLTEPELRALIDVGLQANVDTQGMLDTRHDLERRRLVRRELRVIDADLKVAIAASARRDWGAALEAVRMIQGNAVVARRVLEGMLGSYPTAADLPPLVRAVQAVGRVISDREVDRLAPDELRARMHAVLHALDHELQAFLEPPEESPVPAAPDCDAPPGDASAPELP
jgi:hypothetical protein